MKFSSLALSAASLMAMAAAGPSQPQAAPRPRQVVKRQKAQIRIQPRFTGRRYPEQSTRQAQRGMRRAQGGPGLVLKGGEYHPRTGYPEAA